MENNKPQFFSVGFLSTRKETIEWLKQHNVKNYTVNDDLTVDVVGDVNLFNKHLKIIPVKFGKISGNFWCNKNKLTSLTGSPKTVGGDFHCAINQLTSLVGSPETVKGYFWCPHNQLANLIGAPKIVGGNFWCDGNKLTNLLGGPESVGDYFSCSNNKLTSLAGAPKTVSGNFLCTNNPLASLFELIVCDVKQKFLFSIDEKSFKQKELIQILKKYYNSRYKRYELTNSQFHDIIKPVLEKEILQQKLVNSRIKNETKPSFI